MADINETLRDTLLKRTHYIHRFENGTVNEVVSHYNRAKPAMIAQLATLEKKLATGTYRSGYTLQWRIDRLNAQIGEMAAILDTATTGAVDGLSYNLSQFAMSEKEYYEQLLNSKFEKIGIDIARIPYEQLDTLVSSPLGGPTGMYDWQNRFVNRYRESLVTMRDELAQSMIRGEDMAKAGRRVFGVGEGMGGTMGKRIMTQSNVIARTEIMRASVATQKAIYDANQDILKGMEHISTLDARTCLACAVRDGNVYYFKKNPPTVGDIPPIHPLCRCVLSPITKSWKELGDKTKGEVPLGTRASFTGQIPSVLDYPSWLRKMDVEDNAFVKGILGKRYDPWKAGKLELREMVKSNRILSLDELDELMKKKAIIKPKPELEPKKIVDPDLEHLYKIVELDDAAYLEERKKIIGDMIELHHSVELKTLAEFEELTEKATRFIPYDLLDDMNKAGVKIRLHGNWEDNRAYYYGKVCYLFESDLRRGLAISHEMAHAIDDFFGGIKGKYGYWGDVKYATEKEATVYRKWFKNQHSGEAGKYDDGGSFWKNNWIDDYEGRIYSDPLGEALEWWSMNVQRWADYRMAVINEGKEAAELTQAALMWKKNVVRKYKEFANFIEEKFPIDRRIYQKLPKPKPKAVVKPTYKKIDDPTEWGDKHFANWRRDLPAHEREAVDYYLTEGFEDINKYLRFGGVDEALGDIVKRVDDALGVIPENIVVYRGTPVRGGMKVGLKIPGSKGFTSTSLDEVAAATQFADPKKGALFEMRIPKGTKGAYIKPGKAHGMALGGESEVLLGRGLKLEIIGEESVVIKGTKYKKFIMQVGDETKLKTIPKPKGVAAELVQTHPEWKVATQINDITMGDFVSAIKSKKWDDVASHLDDVLPRHPLAHAQHNLNEVNVMRYLFGEGFSTRDIKAIMPEYSKVSRARLYGKGAPIKPIPTAQAKMMTKRQIDAVGNHFVIDKQSRGVAEYWEREVARRLNAEHIGGTRPFDFFLDNEFIEFKTVLRNEAGLDHQLKVDAAAKVRKATFSKKYGVRGHQVAIDADAGSDFFGQVFYRSDIGKWRLKSMEQIGHIDDAETVKKLTALLKRGSRKEVKLDRAVKAKVPNTQTLKQSENWMKRQLDIDVVDYDEVDVAVSREFNRYARGAIDELGVKPKSIHFDESYFVGRNKEIAALSFEDGTVAFNPKFFKTIDDLERLGKEQFRAGQFVTDSKGHIFRHELGHQRYFNLGGTEASSGRKLSKGALEELKKGIGKANLPKFVSKYSLSSEGEFYAEMTARLLAGKPLHPVARKVMTNIERRIKKDLAKSVGKKGRGAAAKVKGLPSPIKALANDLDFLLDTSDVYGKSILKFTQKELDNLVKDIEGLIKQGLFDKDVLDDIEKFIYLKKKAVIKKPIKKKFTGTEVEQARVEFSDLMKQARSKYGDNFVNDLNDLYKVVANVRSTNIHPDAQEIAKRALELHKKMGTKIVHYDKVSVGWKNSKTLKELEKQLGDLFNIRSFVAKGKFATGEGVEVSNVVGEVFDDLFKRFPSLRRAQRVAPNRVEIHFNFSESGFLEGERGKRGVFLAASNELSVGFGKGRTISSLVPKIGDYTFNIDESLQGILRHEIGHNFGVQEWRILGRWEDLYNKKGSGWFAENVSMYSETSYDEAFAESFSAFTSPKYKRGMLPKEVESFFDDFMKAIPKEETIDDVIKSPIFNKKTNA